MPLTPGKSKATISHNIHEMVSSGHSQKQAVAASLHNADKYAEGGEVTDDGLLDQCASEAIHAALAKDVTKFKDAMHVLIAHSINSMNKDQE
jgi:hypothetical protein